MGREGGLRPPSRRWGLRVLGLCSVPCGASLLCQVLSTEAAGRLGLVLRPRGTAGSHLGAESPPESGHPQEWSLGWRVLSGFTRAWRRCCAAWAEDPGPKGV